MVRRFMLFVIVLLSALVVINLHLSPVPVVRIPSVIAQAILRGSCPLTYASQPAFAFHLPDGSTFAFGCMDNVTGNFSSGGSVYVAPPVGNADVGSQVNAAIAALPTCANVFQT